MAKCLENCELYISLLRRSHPEHVWPDIGQTVTVESDSNSGRELDSDSGSKLGSDSEDQPGSSSKGELNSGYEGVEVHVPLMVAPPLGYEEDHSG
jgi:hypothetical protein